MALKKARTNVKTFAETRRALNQLQIQIQQLTGSVGGISALPATVVTKKETRFTFLATGSPVSV